MDEQRTWLKLRIKGRLRILAVILCICALFTTYPGILEAFFAFAEGKSEIQEQTDTTSGNTLTGAGSQTDDGTLTENGSQPGSGTSPDDGGQPGSGTSPDDGGQPGSGTLPDGSGQPESGSLTQDTEGTPHEDIGEASDIQGEQAAPTTEGQTQIPEASGVTHEHDGVIFKEWSDSDSLPSEEGSYYLTADIELTDCYEISGSINICLCGHTIKGSVSGGMIRVYENELSVYDCQENGQIYCPEDNNPIRVSRGGVLSLYGGSVKAEIKTAVLIGEADNNAGGTVNIYPGASITGGSNGILVNKNSEYAEVNIYGGTVQGKASINMQNVNGSIQIYGDADINSAIATVIPVKAAQTEQSGLNRTYTIQYTDVQNGTIVVYGSTDDTRYKLDHAVYVLMPEGGNLCAREIYAVALNGNGGNGTQLESYASGVEKSLPTDWKKDGYTFDGWYEDSDFAGSNVTSIPAAATGDKTYYAKWEADVYDVTYHTNNGTVTDEDNYTSYTYGEGLTLPEPTRTGYTFDGWYENEELSGTAVETISSSNMGDKSYWAKWTANTYAITYNINSKAITEKTMETIIDEEFTSYTCGEELKLPTPERAGYAFAGWYEDETLTGTAVETISVTDIGNKSYWAKWQAVTYKVTLDYCGADGGNGVQSINVAYDGVYGSLPVPLRAGYAFDGWYTETDGQGSKIGAETVVKREYPHTLYAYWTGKKEDVPVNNTTLKVKEGDKDTDSSGLSDGEEFYSVDVEWGAMTFWYESGTWDTTEHKSGEGAGWKVYDKEKGEALDSKTDPINRIQVTNYSNVAVTAKLVYAGTNGYGDTLGSFGKRADDQVTDFDSYNKFMFLGTADNAAEKKPTVGTVYLLPGEAREEIKQTEAAEKWSQLGTITVYIKPEQEDAKTQNGQK